MKRCKTENLVRISLLLLFLLDSYMLMLFGMLDAATVQKHMVFKTKSHFWA